MLAGFYRLQQLSQLRILRIEREQFAGPLGGRIQFALVAVHGAQCEQELPVGGEARMQFFENADCLRAAARSDPALANNPPRVEYTGFFAEVIKNPQIVVAGKEMNRDSTVGEIGNPHAYPAPPEQLQAARDFSRLPLLWKRIWDPAVKLVPQTERQSAVSA